MDVEEIKGTDKIFRVKIEALQQRCSELEGLISRMKSTDSSDDQIKIFTQLLVQKEKEILSLKERIAELENIANDELVLIETKETKEVYGKKGKVENIKETVVIEDNNRETYQSTLVENEKTISYYQSKVSELE